MVAQKQESYNYSRPEFYVAGERQNFQVGHKLETESTLPYNREILGPEAFNLEYFSYSTPEEIRADIISYLGEYRFALQKSDYVMVYSCEGTGNAYVRDPQRGEPMSIKARRAIEERKLQDKVVNREQAELEGMLLLDEKLRHAKTGDTIFWASPPGPQDDGYGDYGFIYTGKVEVDNEDPNRRELHMTAVRVENPSFDQFRTTLSLLIGRELDFKSAEDFLANPEVIDRDIPQVFIDKILELYCGINLDSNEKEKFKKVIQEIDPLINEVVAVIKNGKKDEKLKAFYTLENYSLKLKTSYQDDGKEKISYIDSPGDNLRISDLMPFYNYQPPVIKGSCHDTSSIKSNNIFSNSLDKLTNSLFGDNQEWFSCPKCNYKADGPVGDTCPKCGLTKEAYAEETGISCD